MVSDFHFWRNCISYWRGCCLFVVVETLWTLELEHLGFLRNTHTHSFFFFPQLKKLNYWKKKKSVDSIFLWFSIFSLLFIFLYHTLCVCVFFFCSIFFLAFFFQFFWFSFSVPTGFRTLGHRHRTTISRIPFFFSKGFRHRQQQSETEKLFFAFLSYYRLIIKQFFFFGTVIIRL